VWDAQKDVFLALSGAIIATTIVSLIKKLMERKSAAAATVQ
jgi:putative membrane protein